MFIHRLVLSGCAASCAVLLILSGCKSSKTTGGGSPTTETEESKALEKAKQISKNNLYQIGIALHSFHGANNCLPSAGYVADKNKPLPQDRRFVRSWRVQILPYLEQLNLYNQIPEPDPFAAIPEKVAKSIVPIYLNPLKAETPTPMTHYRVFVGGAFEVERGVSFQHITDGLSNTFLVVEATEPVAWSSTDELIYDPKKPLPKLGIFPGGFHALLGDGSVTWIPSDTPEANIRGMITRNGGEIITGPGETRDPSLPPEPEPAVVTQVPVPPAVSNEAAKQISINNLKQIGIALLNHEAAMQYLPSAGIPDGMKAPPGFHFPHSWRVAILPYIEQDNLWRLIPNNAMGPLPERVRSTSIDLYSSPLALVRQPQTNYRVFVGNGAAFDWAGKVRITDFTDGTSNTILVVESAEPINWSTLDDFVYDPKKPLPKLGIFPGGFHALMADGTVRWIPADTDEKTIRAMITRNGGETVKLPGSIR